MEKTSQMRITITWQTFLTLVAVVIGLWLLYQVRDIVLLLLLAVTISITFTPLVNSLSRFMPRVVAILLFYLLLIVVIAATIALMVPPFLNQSSELLLYLERLRGGLNASAYSSLQTVIDRVQLVVEGKNTQALLQLLSDFRGSFGTVYATTLGFFGGLLSTVTVLIASFYMLLDESMAGRLLTNFIPSTSHDRVSRISKRISLKMGGWLKGQILLMIIIGLLDGVALGIAGIPYALVLGVWAGLTELLPYIGPVLGAIPGILIALTIGNPVKAVIAFLIYVVVQQLESNFIVPKLMNRVLGLNPVVVIFALLIGGQLLGIIGVLISVPIAAGLSVIYEEWVSPEKMEESRQ